MPTPSWGQGIVRLGFLFYPTYRLELIGIVAALLFALYLVLYRTSIGLVVRAGIEDARMVGVLGINVRRAFLAVFALGVLAAGAAGMLYAPIVSVQPDMGGSFLVEAFVVIVIGGLGSYPGAVVGEQHRRQNRLGHQPPELHTRPSDPNSPCGRSTSSSAITA